MRVCELKALLEDVPDEYEVRVATQQNYPLQATALGICTTEMLYDHEAAEEEEDENAQSPEICRPENQDVCWLIEGSQIYRAPYAPGGLWDAMKSW